MLHSPNWNLGRSPDPIWALAKGLSFRIFQKVLLCMFSVSAVPDNLGGFHGMPEKSYNLVLWLPCPGAYQGLKKLHYLGIKEALMNVIGILICEMFVNILKPITAIRG